jgi:hypothetical protein
MDAVEATDRLAEIHYKCLKSWATVRTFLTVSRNGLAASRKAFYEQAYSLPEQLESSDWFIPDKTKLTPDFRNMLATSLSEARTLEAQSVSEAFALVFAHSTLDATATDLCDLIARISPKDWEPAVIKKKVELAELNDMPPYDVVLQSFVLEYIEKEVARKSLPDRVELINQKCQPFPKTGSWQLYIMDPRRLRAFDERRHNIVHRLQLKTSGPDVEQDALYCETTCLYLTHMVAYKYNVQVDVDAMRRAAQKLA